MKDCTAFVLKTVDIALPLFAFKNCCKNIKRYTWIFLLQVASYLPATPLPTPPPHTHTHSTSLEIKKIKSHFGPAKV